VQRPSLLPKDSAEFRGWYEALPQTQLKDSQAYKAWAKAWAKGAPPMQPKKTEAYREWLRAVRENASRQSVDSHQWFKSKPATADTDADVRQLWYSQKPTVRQSRTGPSAKSKPNQAFGERVGAKIGQGIGAVKAPQSSAMSDASNAKEYKCLLCGKSFKMRNKKRDMIFHLGHADNTK